MIKVIDSDLVVFSGFDGMGGGRLALDRLRIKPKKYYASEVDKHAIKETSANWDDVEHLGDITKWGEWDIDWSSIDLIFGGSPCQGFSFAGKQLAFDDPRSALFFVYCTIVSTIKIARRLAKKPPPMFLLENVKMKKEHLNVISDFMGVEPVFINSALMSAQNRQRWYWCNWPVELPKDKGILLKDIIEPLPLNPTMMSDKFINRQRGRKCLVDDFERKASNLSAMEYVKNGRQGDYIRCASMIGRRINKETGKRDDNNKKIKPIQIIEIRNDKKTNCLTTVPKDNLIVIREKSKCVRSSGRNSVDRHEWDSISDCHYRKLTVIECCRLQTVPDDYFKVSSNTQAYKMLGNGWTIDIIANTLIQCPLIMAILKSAGIYEVVKDALER